MPLVSLDALHEVFRDFYNLTGFKIVLFDRERRPVDSYPKAMCRFCEEVRLSNELADKCHLCDSFGFDEVDKTGKAYIYKCHMGATEAISPIYAGEERVGYLMLGQIVEGDTEELKACAERANECHGINISGEMIAEMRLVSREYLASAVNMMSMCAEHLYTNKIVTTDPDILAHRISAFIDENIKTADLDSVCHRFYISRSRLYSICTEFFGMGISDLIRHRRIKLAEKYLSENDYSVSRVAELVGIKSASYLIRAFKDEIGMTPFKYREKIRRCK